MAQKKTKITQKMIYRAVASSTAIETGSPVQKIEKRLKTNKRKYNSLSLAN
ncbi:hypothetical protein [Vibrio toranzoniae]|jgi:hypothetical protein|uniref:hypothetical protein n=1 Tax=Vibrio toranzoniae TaxID=1194427 RepID=UPI001929DDBB|nr:hypothetical protein [Vibrio toranzoniae]